MDTFRTFVRTELRWAVADASVMAGRNLLKYTRSPDLPRRRYSIVCSSRVTCNFPDWPPQLTVL